MTKRIRHAKHRDLMSLVKLHNWMEANRSILTEQTAETLARKATRAVGFLVATTQVQRMRRRMGIECYTPRGITPVQPEAGRNPAWTAVEILRDSTVGLYRAAGMTPPTSLVKLSRSLALA